jgi:hypothetical protein
VSESPEASLGSGVWLRPDAKAGHDLGDKLLMPDNPVALSEFGLGLPALLLAHRALDDLLILVVVVLELTPGRAMIAGSACPRNSPSIICVNVHKVSQ